MLLKRILLEPLLHFAVIGAALFLGFHWAGGRDGADAGPVVVTAGRIATLSSGFTRSWQRAPSEVEMKALIDDWVREELAVREAMASGLDRDDPIVRRRLRQKLEFLAEDLAAATAPTEPELQAWLTTHADKFGRPAQLALRQVYVNPEHRGVRADADARAVLARLIAGGADAPTDQLGDATMLAREVERRSVDDVAAMFGRDFADRVAALPPGRWSGPVRSGYGLHLVLVREHIDASVPELAAVRAEVEREFLFERRTQQLAAMYEGLLAKTVVVFEPAGGS